MDSITYTIGLIDEIAGHLEEHPACVRVDRYWDQVASAHLGRAVYRLRAYYRDDPAFLLFPLEPVTSRIGARTNLRACAEWHVLAEKDRRYVAVWNFTEAQEG